LGDLNLFLENENKNKNPEAILIAAFPPEKNTLVSSYHPRFNSKLQRQAKQEDLFAMW